MTVSSHRLELLSPARDAAIAREAILHGADAVYIGGPGFGARHNASNSLKDIAELVPFAHRYGAKIFVTLNTILHDDELEPAQRLITDLYQTGVDALIVQDMGILELDIPPIELHASTQCDIRTVEKAKFLSDVGFTQIVLARELNLEQIRAIHQATDATIEFFIHGALCVAYSGQCYISHAQTGRSANRGDCSQACRLPYTLKDDQGRVVSYEKHLLSMKDNDQTANLGALIDAGVRSFKIEGRYKDMSYVKNITAHYRQMLDAIIEERGDLARASSGRTEHFFVPSTEKTFHRGSTDYFVNARKGDIGAFDSPKFIGLPVGEVLKVAKDHLDVAVTEPLANGDGLNVMIKREVIGFRANTVEKTGLECGALGNVEDTVVYEVSGQEAHGHGQLVQGYEGSSLFGHRDFGNVDRGDYGHEAHTYAPDDPECHELGKSRTFRASYRADAEKEGRCQHGLLPSDAVADRSRHAGSGYGADEGATYIPSLLHRIQGELLRHYPYGARNHGRIISEKYSSDGRNRRQEYHIAGIDCLCCLCHRSIVFKMWLPESEHSEIFPVSVV